MQCMRTKLGPYASEAAIQYHLRSARGKVFWAVNTYFRAVLAEQVRQADFEPKEYAQLANCRTPAPPNLMQGSGSREQSSFDSIPSPVLEHVLRHCNLLTVCNAASACSSLHQAATSDLVWNSLYRQRWGSAKQDDHKLLQEQSQHDRYRERHLAEHGMQCPGCKQAKIIPIVYGFPSHLLVRNMRANKLRMGNDHLIEGQPTWTCSSCSEVFANFPYISLEIIGQ
ncbi:hypothetical protein ABBQ38_002060 [Trebouxia sp. C0009 RCD-2024]